MNEARQFPPTSDSGEHTQPTNQRSRQRSYSPPDTGQSNVATRGCGDWQKGKRQKGSSPTLSGASDPHSRRRGGTEVIRRPFKSAASHSRANRVTRAGVCSTVLPRSAPRALRCYQALSLSTEASSAPPLIGQRAPLK